MSLSVGLCCANVPFCGHDRHQMQANTCVGIISAGLVCGSSLISGAPRGPSVARSSARAVCASHHNQIWTEINVPCPSDVNNLSPPELHRTACSVITNYRRINQHCIALYGFARQLWSYTWHGCYCCTCRRASAFNRTRAHSGSPRRIDFALLFEWSTSVALCNCIHNAHGICRLINSVVT